MERVDRMDRLDVAPLAALLALVLLWQLDLRDAYDTSAPMYAGFGELRLTVKGLLWVLALPLILISLALIYCLWTRKAAAAGDVKPHSSGSDEERRVSHGPSEAYGAALPGVRASEPYACNVRPPSASLASACSFAPRGRFGQASVDQSNRGQWSMADSRRVDFGGVHAGAQLAVGI